MIFINIHTHQTTRSSGWHVQNLHKDFENTSSLFQYSAGLHPWYLNEKTWSHDFNLLESAHKKKELIAVGECGLDRKCDTPFKLQEEVFIRHIELANQLAKPLIIHCVRAYPDTLKLLKDYRIHVPVIFHGFQSNEFIAKQILDYGYYLSFGAGLLNPSCETVFNKISLQSIFLETDDQEINIEEIYKQACCIKQIPLENLQFQIQINTKKVFKAYNR